MLFKKCVTAENMLKNVFSKECMGMVTIKKLEGRVAQLEGQSLNAVLLIREASMNF